jgi:trehalose-6-phosphate synthase
MVLQSRLLILFKPKISFYPFNGLIFVLRSIEELFKNYPIKAVKLVLFLISIFARNSVSVRQKTRIVLQNQVPNTTSQYRKSNVLVKILKTSI